MFFDSTPQYGVWFGEQPLPPFFFLLTPSFSVYVHSFSMP